MIMDNIIVKENLEEVLPHAQEVFPYTSIYVELAKYCEGHVQWHWHKEVEMVYVLQGQTHFLTDNGSYLIKAGEAAFINSDVMHSQKPVGDAETITLTQVFDASIISGGYKTIFDQKYVRPILDNPNLSMLLFQPTNKRHEVIIDCIKRAYYSADLADDTYELKVRNALSEAWRNIFLEVAPNNTTNHITRHKNDDRIKCMIEYINQNYAEKITLADIAESANISRREALRTFQSILKTTPFSYLLDYRIRMAAVRLRSTQDPVTRIALDCGFSTPSYFSKVFKETMQMTALQYRKTF